MTNVLFDYKNNRIEVIFNYNIDVISIIKLTDIRNFDWNKKVWFVGLTEVKKLEKMLVEANHSVSYSDNYTKMFLSDKPNTTIWTLEHKRIKDKYPYLFDYQVEDVVKLLNRNEYLIAHEMGTGKTVETLVLLKEFQSQKPDLKGLIVVPVSLVQTWVVENNKFTNLDIRPITGNRRQKELAFKEEHSFYLTNYETIRAFHKNINQIGQGIKFFSNVLWDVVIADEISRIKNRRTFTNNAMKQLKTTKKFALTGTPIENSIADLYSIIHWLTPNVLPAFLKYKELFYIEEHVCLPDGREFNKTLGYKNLPLLKTMISPVFMRREKKEVIKYLPELTKQYIYVKLSDDEEQQYKNFIRDAQRLIDSGEPSIGMSVRIRELLSGIDKKLEECVDICKETSSQIIVFGEYLRGLHKLQAKLSEEKISCELVCGEVSQYEREKIISKYQDGQFKVLILQTKVGGYGLNLQNSSVVVFLNRPWTVATEEQAISRVHRTGQKSAVNVYYLISDTDFEQRVNEILELKQNVHEGVIMNKVMKSF
jgi:SNF2 family DNA or RNA helicase